MQVQFWGVRGSIPVPGPSTAGYGGNTSCVSVRAGGSWIVFDAGTGIRELGLRMIEEDGPLQATIFLSHVHWDHIQGFPFFAPANQSGNHLVVCALRRHDSTFSTVLSGQMEGPHFPIGLDSMGARIEFRDLREGVIQVVRNGEGTIVASVGCSALDHPDGVLAFRIIEASSGACMVYATDYEHPAHGPDPRLVDLARGADLLVTDGTYTPEEYPSHRGWGHSTWEMGLRTARAANVSRVAVFHHNPTHNDAFLEKLEREVVRSVESDPSSPKIFWAREGMTVELDGPGVGI